MTILSNNQAIGSLMFDNMLDTENAAISLKGFIICTVSNKSKLESQVKNLKQIKDIVVTEIVTERDTTKIYVEIPQVLKITSIAQLLNIMETLRNKINYKLKETGLESYELLFQ